MRVHCGRCPPPPRDYSLEGARAPDLAVVEPWPDEVGGLLDSIVERADAVLVFTDCPCPALCQSLLSGRVRGFLGKKCTPDELRAAVREVLSGGYYIQSSMMGDWFRQGRNAAAAIRSQPFMTNRQREIMRGIGMGRSLKQIAADIGISTKTAEHHRRQLFALLSVDNGSSLIRLAIQYNIVPLWDEED